MVVKKAAAAPAAVAARSMTKKRLSLILIMESSRFVIEKKKNVTLSVNSETALARPTPSPHDGYTRHTTHSRAGLESEDASDPPTPRI